MQVLKKIKVIIVEKCLKNKFMILIYSIADKIDQISGKVSHYQVGIIDHELRYEKIFCHHYPRLGEEK